MARRGEGRSREGDSHLLFRGLRLGGGAPGRGAAPSAGVAAAAAAGRLALPSSVGRWVQQPPAEHGAVDILALLPAQRGLGAGALHHLRGRLVLLRVRGGAVRV